MYRKFWERSSFSQLFGVVALTVVSFLCVTPVMADYDGSAAQAANAAWVGVQSNAGRIPEVYGCYCFLKNGDCVDISSNFAPVNFQSAAQAGTPTKPCDDGCAKYNTPDQPGLKIANLIDQKDKQAYDAVLSQCTQAHQSFASKNPVVAPLIKIAPRPYTKPVLSVDIPGVVFNDIFDTDGTLSIPFIADYINGVFKWVIGAAVTFAIVMVMVGGFKYILAAGVDEVKGGKEMIKQAIVGLVLLLSVVVVLYTVNPQLTILSPLSVSLVKPINISFDTNEGSNLPADQQRCLQTDTAAKQAGCPLALDNRLKSPNGKPHSCNYHYTGHSYNYATMSGLDYPAEWGTPIVAPMAGKIEFKIWSDKSANMCGNTIWITSKAPGGGEVKIALCHIRDFVRDNVAKDGTVAKGAIIGHVGGRCCGSLAATAPKDWDVNRPGWCDDVGKVCTDPNKIDNDCQCQPPYQAGRTTGPHTHMTMETNHVYLLSCIE